ncbi:probable cytosolic oligopeptidase A isoform X2 [Lingula anatina]|uniref:Probable cytosolic oligopeptidase A isoform X1 n=1 Tax=Lingula anatina TaxID=7574 RepID=A0A1S3JPD9_LINAN|nr:probable cytosolic oligopeptidase A isoform X1 [Lingula anatina]XP_013412230.1 probable cytosolic oligopeptidase A isoform X2 [Lingula anatina]|eukprot:XP_013412229.1 probable cytosolic oligopeptidase A isoform X1 [Lingula anatina]
MAASLARMQLLKPPRSLWSVRRYSKTMRPNEFTQSGDRGQGYYILLPEVPQDTPKTNPLLETLENETPAFDKNFKRHHLLKGLTKIAAVKGSEFLDYFESLQVDSAPESFDSVIRPYEEICAQLLYASATSAHLGNLDVDLTKSIEVGQAKINKILTDRWANENFWNVLKKLEENKENLTDIQQRYLDVLLNEFFKVGFKLENRKREELLKGQHDLSEDCKLFKGRISFCQSLFRRIFHHKSTISGLPEDFLQYISTNEENPAEGPWAMPLNIDVYKKVMLLADSRELRMSIYKIWNLRASEEYSQNMASNIEELNNIRMDRNYVAQNLGFDSHVDMLLSRSMAGSADDVMGLIYDVKTNLEPLLEAELKELEEFNKQAFNKQYELEVWDVHYLAFLLKREVFLGGFEGKDSISYFPLDHVLDTMFNFTQELFGFKLEESHGEYPVWTDGVRVFKVYSEEGEHISYLYIDQFIREEMEYEPSCQIGRAHSEIFGSKPIAYLSLSAMNSRMMDDTSDEGSSFNFIEMNYIPELFQQFGNALGIVLNRVPYTELSAGLYTEVDAQGIPGLVMGYFGLQPHIVQMFSKHVTTGEQLTEAMARKICIANQYLMAYDLMHDLYTAAFDLEMHLSLEGSPMESKKKLWPLFMPLPLPVEDMSEFSNTRVFTETPGYCYAPIWTSMVAADIFEAFSDVDPQDVKMLNEIGRRFRNTFLYYGGGLPAKELFRRFRGRDPDLLPFLRVKTKYRAWLEEEE